MVEIKYLVPFLTLFLGVLIGNWLALGRDKRKEHNAVVLPLKQKVLSYIEHLKDSRHLNLTASEIKPLRGIVSERKYENIRTLYSEFTELVIFHQQVARGGCIIYSSEGNEEISNKLKEIDRVLTLK